MCDFMQEVDISARRKFWDEKRAEKVEVVLEVPVAEEKVEEKVVVEQEKEVVDSLVGSKFEMIEEPIVVAEAAVVEPIVAEVPAERKVKKVKGKKSDA